MSEGKKVLLALLVSVLLHLLGILGLMVWASSRSSARTTFPAPEPRQITMTVAPLPKEPEPVLKQAAAPSPTPVEINSDGLAKANATPDRPLFESDINSRAASRLAASGMAPLPSQEGKERPFPEFESKKYSLGQQRQPPEMEMAPAPEPARGAQPEETPAPTPKPRKPEPSPRPLPTATPKDILAMAASPTPEPAATPDDIPKPTPVMHGARKQDLAMLVTPAPRRPRRPAYQPETEETRVSGSISNLGSKPGADVISTPLGRYRKTIADAIGSRWYFYINQKMDLITVGSVHIKFYINERGRVEDIKILSNSANGAFGDFSVQSVSEAELPPLPPDLAPKLQDGRLEVDYTFTIYPN